ncbi:exportin-5 [Condylostylus longicornis]|uniref:exportin-5 n=1 Tax=Condylostylus longicornis TaxID=2530218 RepID=UPI00244DB44A|nr:exportin-5 [Condylostylus longicornis]
MEQNPNIPALANELAQAIEVIMNPVTPQTNRMEAYIACEQFKEASPLCAQAGLYLAGGQQYNSNVKHFGLQLMEHTIRLKWNTISQEEKIFIKENAMKLLLTGVGPAEDTSLSHLKDALSRIIVEMIKREWPQQWTTLLSELSDACTKGEAQTELVLLIFLRLVEDVALLQTIESNQRRKDIYAALTSNMSEIFEFFLRLIELHVTAFRESTSLGNIQKASAHSRVVQVVLLTLTGFVEWVSINHIMCGDGKILHILCILLNDSAFQIDAAECLAQIVNRKGQVKDRKPLLTLFSESPMNYIYTSAQTPPLGATIEQNHAFLKKLTQVFNGLAQLITALWGKDDGAIQRPQHFSAYLEALYIITRHPSLTVAHGAAQVWTILLKHDQISKDPYTANYIPKLIQVVGPRIVKIGYPNSRSISITMTTESFISLEYDSEEEYFLFFHRARTDFMEIFRQTTLIAPIITFGYCEQWLKMRLAKSHSEINTNCSVFDPVYLEWEALVTVLDGVLSRILMVTERPAVTTGLNLLEDCLKVNTNDPVIISIVLSCISALFVFLSMSSCQLTSANCVAMSGVSLLPRVLDKIFSALVYPFDDDDPIQMSSSSNLQKELKKITKREAVKNLRRHSASLMVKLAIKFPLLLLPVFEQINSTVKNFARQAAAARNSSNQITKNTQTTLNEALLIISNHFCDYERQTAFVAEVLAEAQLQWVQLTTFFKSPLDFMSFVGLNKPPAKDMDTDPTAQNRGKILDALNIVVGVLKRCTWPDDPDRASRGGFVVGLTESGNPICRNPAASHIIPLLPNILSLLRVLNELFKPEALNSLSEGYKNVHSLLEHEKRSLMGIPPIMSDPMDPVLRKPPTMLEKMQNFMAQLFDNCYHLMGQSGPSLGRDLYQLPGIADALINSVFTSMELIPDYRLRPIIRVFFKPFVYSCAVAFHEPVLIPIFTHLSPFMLNRLTHRWQYITALYESGELSEEISDTQEVFEDMLNRSLTREYLDVLRVALVGGTINPSIDRNDQVNIINDVTMDQDELSMDGATHNTTRATQSALTSEVISDLGGKLLKNPLICNSLVMTILSAISWNDSNCSVKSVQLTAPVMRYLAAEQLLTPSIATNALIAVLRGLQVHGQHETIQSPLITLGVQVYEILRPKFPNVFEIMQRIPNINSADLQKLDEKIATSQTKGNKIDKSKKDLFKKITSQLINRSINQLFRHEIQIANLPPMNLSGRNRTLDQNRDILAASAAEDAGLTKLFSPARNLI